MSDLRAKAKSTIDLNHTAILEIHPMMRWPTGLQGCVQDVLSSINVFGSRTCRRLAAAYSGSQESVSTCWGLLDQKDQISMPKTLDQSRLGSWPEHGHWPYM